tara:strand:+ start:193 stop:498 length:306 start_codon:yes stop_codon:yes gene_type:complete
MNFENLVGLSIDISDENGKLCCKIVVPIKNSHFPYRLNIKTLDVLGLLGRKGHKIYSVLKEDAISNKSESSNNSGEWIFSTIAPKPKKKTSRSRATKTSNK